MPSTSLDPHSTDLPSRVSRVETLVTTLHDDLLDLKSSINASLRTINDSLSSSGKTNWSVVFSGLALIGAMWAAAVRPLNYEIDQQREVAKEITRTLIAQNEHGTKLQLQSVKDSAQIDILQRDSREFREVGSPNSDRRLSILEQHIKDIDAAEKDVAEIKTELTKIQVGLIKAETERGAIREKVGDIYVSGVPIVDKRLSLIEQRLSDKDTRK